MRRASTVTALSAATVAALSLPALPHAAVAGAAELPQASVRTVECSLVDHAAAFKGRMLRVEGTERMGMRFTLLERTDARGFRPVKATGLGRWNRSKPGVGTFAYRQDVKGLPENALHRMRVDFRWYAPDGRVLAQLQRKSRSCRQFVALPNLKAKVVGSARTKVRGVSRYSVQVSNAGRAAVAGSALRFSVDGSVLNTVTLGRLAVGEQRLIGFRGPACTGSVKVEVDPDGLIAESSEQDNVQELSCAEIAPAPSTA